MGTHRILRGEVLREHRAGHREGLPAGRDARAGEEGVLPKVPRPRRGDRQRPLRGMAGRRRDHKRDHPDDGRLGRKLRHEDTAQGGGIHMPVLP